MEFIKIFFMVFIPILIGIAVYWCFKKFKTSVVDSINMIGRAETAVKTQLKNPRYIKFSSSWETTATRQNSTWTVKGWVEIKDKWDENERHEYSVDIVAKEWKKGKFIYETESLTIK